MTKEEARDCLATEASVATVYLYKRVPGGPGELDVE